MAIIRIFAGEDGESHFEELDPASHPLLITVHPAVAIEFKSIEVGYFSDWHTAPRRQYVISLSGEMEISIGDGTVRHFKPGDVLLADDLTGRGHTTRTIGNNHTSMYRSAYRTEGAVNTCIFKVQMGMGDVLKVFTLYTALHMNPLWADSEMFKIEQ